jgi:hypothetical protein
MGHFQRFKLSPLRVTLAEQVRQTLPLNLVFRVSSLKLRTRRGQFGFYAIVTLLLLVDRSVQPQPFRHGSVEFGSQIERGQRLALPLTDGELLFSGQRLLQLSPITRMGRFQRLKLRPLRVPLVEQVRQTLSLDLVFRLCCYELRTRRGEFGFDAIVTLLLLVDRSVQPLPFRHGSVEFGSQIERGLRLALPLTDGELMCSGQRLLQLRPVGRMGRLQRFKLPPLRITLVEQIRQTLSLDLVFRVCCFELRTRRRKFDFDAIATLSLLVDRTVQPEPFRQGSVELGPQIERGLRLAPPRTDGELLFSGQRLLQLHPITRMGRFQHFKLPPLRVPLVEQVRQTLPLDLVFRVCRLKLRPRRVEFGFDAIVTLLLLVDRSVQPQPFRHGLAEFGSQIERALRLALPLTDGELLFSGQRLLQLHPITRMGRFQRFKLPPLRVTLVEQVRQTLSLDLVFRVCRLELRPRRGQFGFHAIVTLLLLVDRDVQPQPFRQAGAELGPQIERGLRLAPPRTEGELLFCGQRLLQLRPVGGMGRFQIVKLPPIGSNLVEQIGLDCPHPSHQAGAAGLLDFLLPSKTRTLRP